MRFQPADTYNQKIKSVSERLKILEYKLSRLFLFRMLSFFGGTACIFIAHDVYGDKAFYGVLLVLMVFLPLVKKSLSIQKQISFEKVLMQINEHEIQFLNGDLASFKDGRKFIDPDHPYSNDLDVFGPDSLFHRINRICTMNGEGLLAESLRNPVKDRSILLSRQKTLIELRDELDWRQHFLASGHVVKGKDYYRDEFMGWLDSPPVFITRKEKWFWRISPFIAIALLIAAFASVLSFVPFSIYFVFQLLITGRYMKNIGKIYTRISRISVVFESYENLLIEIEKKEFRADELKALKIEMLNGIELPSKGIRKLFRILTNMDAQLNVIVGPLLNGLFLWALQYICQLEEWKENYRSRFPVWINCLAKMDVLVSYANFAYNHPDFVFPSIRSDHFIFKAESIAHPFLKAEVRVGNDFEMGQEKLIILTGANMAGKSTFLRSVGLNLVLAMTGSPVCAKSFIFYPIDLYSSLRTSDSISKNESFFLAELKKLKMIIDLYEHGNEVFIFLDEILKGTNSKDQHLGSEKLIRKLSALNARGLIATHDVELGSLSIEMPNALRNACFEVEINDDEFIFDYKLKPGICKTMNASVLMKKMNII